MNFNFKGKTAVITGAARGIGYACAELLSKNGAIVALVDILEDQLTESVKKFRSMG